jgi:hypothetical protein
MYHLYARISIALSVIRAFFLPDEKEYPVQGTPDFNQCVAMMPA